VFFRVSRLFVSHGNKVVVIDTQQDKIAAETLAVQLRHLIEQEAQMKRLMSLLISGTLIAGSAGLAMAQQSDKDGVKQTTKDVGHDTKRAGKAIGKEVKKTTRKVVHKGARVTQKGAEKVEDKTETKK
jgi:hypothetical protein